MPSNTLALRLRTLGFTPSPISLSNPLPRSQTKQTVEEKQQSSEQITLLSSRELDKMRQACQLAAKLLDYLTPLVKPGVSTLELNDQAEAWTRKHGAKSAPLGYAGTVMPFPKSICTSVNEVICHGIPSADQVLRDGDIINIDVTPIVDRYHGDTSRTFLVGDVSPLARRLVEVTEECMWRGIREVKPGARVGDIGAAIQAHAEAEGFSVVRDFVGHGVHRIFHAAPQIPHYGVRGKGKKLRPGMVFTIEPMINIGSHEAEVLADGWTALTVDRQLSAQFEHTVAVTSTGVEVLTLSPAKVLA
ncbi:MAG: type I methionyl aminopeptidase [Nodosilinea sp.]